MLRTPNSIEAERRRSAIWSWGLFGLLLLAGLALAPWPNLLFTVLASEQGVSENLTVVFAWAGAIVALRIFGMRKRLPHPSLGWFFFLFALGLIFLGGEEISWGQQWFRFATPEGLAEANLQGETNLHNLSLEAERIPKTVLSLAILVTGVFWPIWAAITKHGPRLGGWFGWIWPATYLWPSAAIAFLLRIYERVCANIDVEDGPFRPYYMYGKESIELFYGLFMLLFLLSVLRRLNGPNADQ